MPAVVNYKHYARVYVCKGNFIDASAPNVLGVAEFKVSDIRNDGVYQSDVVENTADVIVLRPNLKFRPEEIVLFSDTNATNALLGLKLKLDFKAA
jgi:hypothetical protein